MLHIAIRLLSLSMYLRLRPAAAAGAAAITYVQSMRATSVESRCRHAACKLHVSIAIW